MEEIFGSLSAIRLSNMDPPPLLRQRSDFHFLLQETQTESAERCLWFHFSFIDLFAYIELVLLPRGGWDVTVISTFAILLFVDHILINFWMYMGFCNHNGSWKKEDFFCIKEEEDDNISWCFYIFFVEACRWQHQKMIISSHQGSKLQESIVTMLACDRDSANVFCCDFLCIFCLVSSFINGLDDQTTHHIKQIKAYPSLVSSWLASNSLASIHSSSLKVHLDASQFINLDPWWIDCKKLK